MHVRVDKHDVDVVDRECPQRPCFRLGMNHGTFCQGRGYTSYFTKPKAVCWTRHMRGCPTNSICPVCRTVSAREPGRPCEWPHCAGVLVACEND